MGNNFAFFIFGILHQAWLFVHHIFALYLIRSFNCYLISFLSIKIKGHTKLCYIATVHEIHKNGNKLDIFT